MGVATSCIHYLRLAGSMSLGDAAREGLARLRRLWRNRRGRRRDTGACTYSGVVFPAGQSLNRYLEAPPIAALDPEKDWILAVANRYLNHRFDLLGSGWVQVRHGMECRGWGGHSYKMGTVVRTDAAGHWLRDRINQGNAAEAVRIWQLIDEGYVPIYWQLDFRSGFRWNEREWYRDIRFGHRPGVDIKVPWELARMQHLLTLAWAYALSNANRQPDASSDVYAREFRNQVLDFIATNPPRFGVNWHCSMDVAIRVVNWLVTCDMFRATGADFDRDFEERFAASVFDHGDHIVNNLEYSLHFRGNHYLADVVGLLFVAAYLPRTRLTDAWMAFAVQELMSEIGLQFHSDGTNFESSTCYHRLSSELAAHGLAIVLGLPDDKKNALQEYDHRILRVRPALRPAPMPLYPLPGGKGESPIPPSCFDLLEKMAEFTTDLTRPDGRVAQIGDNDNGRLLKIQPAYFATPVSEAKQRFVNLSGYTGLRDEDTYWVEDHLDHSHLGAAISGLFLWSEGDGGTPRARLDTEIVRGLARGTTVLRCTHPGPASDNKRVVTQGGRGLREGLRLSSYPEFGLYIFRSKRLYLAIRCGPRQLKGWEGHAHNDQLSIEVAVDGIPLIVDPGTYCYTSDIAKRNLFRSTDAHNTLIVAGKEQNDWPEGTFGAFVLYDSARPEVLELAPDLFVGQHHGFGAVHRREIHMTEETIHGFDRCKARGAKILAFHLAPGIAVRREEKDESLYLSGEGATIRLYGSPGQWSVDEDLYSPGYGLLCRSLTARTQTLGESIDWEIALDG